MVLLEQLKSYRRRSWRDLEDLAGANADLSGLEREALLVRHGGLDLLRGARGQVRVAELALEHAEQLLERHAARAVNLPMCGRGEGGGRTGISAAEV